MWLVTKKLKIEGIKGHVDNLACCKACAISHVENKKANVARKLNMYDRDDWLLAQELLPTTCCHCHKIIEESI